MENESTFEQLFDKSETYIKTSIELYKHEAVLKSTNIISNLAVNLALFSVVGLFLLFVNIGLSFWVGQLLGEIYFGFFVIALVYLFLAIVLYIFRESWIKLPLSNYFIKEMKEENII